MTPELVIPIARRTPMGIVGIVPSGLRGRVAIIGNAQNVNDLTGMYGGRAAKPKGPVVLVGQDGVTPIYIMTDGQCETAELEDIAHESYERQRRRGGAMNFDELRAQRGMPSRKEAGALMAEAIEDRIKRHQANPVTDPFRRPGEPIRG